MVCNVANVRLKADYCLLLGSLKDATLLYDKAIEKCHSDSDYIWLGSAKEGKAGALVMDNKVFYFICYLQ